MMVGWSEIRDGKAAIIVDSNWDMVSLWGSLSVLMEEDQVSCFFIANIPLRMT